MASHQIKGKWIGGMAYTFETQGGELTIDAQPDFGGEGKGYGPKALMLDALAGCSGIDISSLIKKMRLEVDNIEIDVDARLTEEHPVYYDDVTVTYRFYGSNLNTEKLQKTVDLSVEKYCGVMEMFRQFANVNIEVEFITS